MESKLPSRAWSCDTFAGGLNLVRGMSLSLGSGDDPDLAALQQELDRLKAPTVGT